MSQSTGRPFLANNAFFYYADVAAAAQFYQEVLGFAVVADYGFAKILQIAHSSFLTLVDGARGMHTPDEPKTVTLGLIAEQVEAWYDYLHSQNVTIHTPLTVQPGQAHDGFVVRDPEGYFLEIERFNVHLQNSRLLGHLRRVPPTYAAGPKTERPPDLGVTGTVLWLYYQDLEAIHRFYTAALDLELAVEQDFARIYPTSPSGFLGLVQAGRGLLPYTEQKAVTISLLTPEIERWFARLRAEPAVRLRSEEINARSPRYKAFVAYDPGGYFLEFNTFLAHPDNVALMKALRAA